VQAKSEAARGKAVVALEVASVVMCVDFLTTSVHGGCIGVGGNVGHWV